MPPLINIRTNLATMRNNDAAVYDPNIYGFGPSVTSANVGMSAAIFSNNAAAVYDPEIYGYKSNLVELKTNFTQMRFGNDRPGYGSSGLPYIQTSIPPSPDLLSTKGPGFPIFNPGTTGNLDYPIRGGQVNFQLGQQTFTLSSQIDRTRIASFFKDAPRGDSFLKKQVGLQLTNPKMETGNTLFGLGQSLALPGLLENTRVYKENGANTLIQVQYSGTGAHALRHGLVPFAAYQRHYYLTVNEQNVNNEKSTNRLVNLNALKMTTAVSPFVNPDNVLDINLVNNLGISLNRNVLFQYLGGPGSTYGIGSTSIRRVVDTTKLGVTEKKWASRNAMTYNQIKQQTINNVVEGVATTKIQDFRDQLPGVVLYDSWENKTIDSRFYVPTGFKYRDKLNKLYPFLFENSRAPWELPTPGETSTDDLIKLVFECVSNDDPNYSLALFFRAFLTAGITDNNSAQLNSFRYAGRGENFYTYQGFERSISFSFRLAAGSKEEMLPMYNRLNSLISQVYPDYGPNSGFMRAPLVRITVGDYLYRMPGLLESVNVTVENGSPWDIDVLNQVDELQNATQLPQVLDVSVSFRPIMEELPRRTRTNLLNPGTQFSSDLTDITTTGTLAAKSSQIIANNGSVINDGSIDAINDYSSTRRATQREINEQRENLLDQQTYQEIQRQLKEDEFNRISDIPVTTLSGNIREAQRAAGLIR